MIRKRVRIRDNENFWKFTPETCGEFDMPVVHSCPVFSVNRLDSVVKLKGQRDLSAVVTHFYVDDFQFDRFWNNPERYVTLLRQCRGVIGPDFSTYSDMPRALQIFNQYRNKWLSSFWQARRVRIIPNITWPVGRLENYHLDGMPQGGLIAVSNLGLTIEEMNKFKHDLETIMDRQRPERVLLYGKKMNMSDARIVLFKAAAVRDKMNG